MFDHLKGAIFTMDVSEDGYSTGGKDGNVKLWDPDFKPVTSINLSNSPAGYKGKLLKKLKTPIQICFSEYFIDC